MSIIYKGEKPRLFDLLVLPPQDTPIYFIVERDYGHDNTADHNKFYYESHSCPTNWLDPIYMVQGGDTDPHGVIRYIGTKHEAELPPDETVSPNDRTAAFDAWIASTNGVIPEEID